MNENEFDAPTAIADVYQRLAAREEKSGADIAMELAKAGVRVFPASAGLGAHNDKYNREKKAKSPLSGSGFFHGFLDATADMAAVTKAWRMWPTAMVGVPAEDNGLLVVDLDMPKEGKPGGMETFGAWEAENGQINTVRVRTPSGGWHIYFRAPAGPRVANNASVVGPGVDVRTNGYVIAPGSRLADGGVYVLENPGVAIAPLPAWLEEKLRHPQKEVQKAAPSTPVTALPTTPPPSTSRQPVRLPDPDPASGGDRKSWRAPDGWTNYGRKAVEGVAEDIAGTGEGARHNTIFARARHLGEVAAKGHIPATAFEALKQDMVSAGLRTGQDERDVVAAVRDGFQKGLENPTAPGIPEVEDAPAWYGEDVTGKKRDMAGKTATGAPAPSSEAVGALQWFPLASEDLNGADARRGLSVETCSRFRLEYSTGVTPDGLASTPLIRIPTGPDSSALVDARAEYDVLKGPARETTRRTGSPAIYLGNTLKTADRPIVVTMEELDALSVVDAGGAAIALGSPSNGERLANLVARNRPQHPLLLNIGGSGDSLTIKAKNRLVEALDKAGIAHYDFELLLDDRVVPDINELLRNDRRGLECLFARLRDQPAIESVLYDREEARLQRLSVGAVAETFIDQVRARSGQECEPTGFTCLDTILDGGLYPGLYVVGAVSGLGKTTFCLQVADYLAAGGRDVLVFSLEMSTLELIAKSLSRMSYGSGYKSDWHTTRHFLNARFWDSQWGDREDLADLRCLLDRYRATVGPHLYITEGVGDVGVTRIVDLVRRVYEIRNVAPVVLVDYLQILAPVDPKFTDKQNTDKNVLELKRLSRDYNTTVIGISSFNRENYAASVNLSAFKESGAIEYSSDVVIGIQFEGMDVADESDAARKRRTQSVLAEVDEKSRKGEDQTVQVKVLKNRNGRRGDVYFTLSNRFNTFTELSPDQQEKHRKMQQDNVLGGESMAMDGETIPSSFGKGKRSSRRKSDPADGASDLDGVSFSDFGKAFGEDDGNGEE